MALRGTQAKEDFINSLLQNYQGAFKHEKEIRIPIYDATSGETVQLKITVTCAKDMVECGSENVLPSTVNVPKENVAAASNNDIVEPTKEEMENIKSLISKFNL